MPVPTTSSGSDQSEERLSIYFIEAPEQGLIKIGYALKVVERFNGMLTMSPVPLSLLGTIPGGPRKEAELHAALAGHRAHGEWFHKTPEVMAVVATATAIYGQEFYNQVARQRGAGLQEYLAKMKAGEVVRPTRGPAKRPRQRTDRYAWSPSDPFRKEP